MWGRVPIGEALDKSTAFVLRFALDRLCFVTEIFLVTPVRSAGEKHDLQVCQWYPYPSFGDGSVLRQIKHRHSNSGKLVYSFGYT